jgi:hypothetical protein
MTAATVIQGMDIITTIDEFIIALRTTRLTITVTGIAIITVNIGRTMINPRLEILVGELPNLQYSHNSLPHFRRAHVWRRGCKQFGTRGVLDCKATDTDDPTEDARFGKVGKQTIKDSGPLNRKRMETVEEELLSHSLDFMERTGLSSNDGGSPFYFLDIGKGFSSSRRSIYN